MKKNSKNKIEADETARVEIGDSGVRYFGGYIQSDYNPKLNGRAAMEKWDEMRKSDGTVAAAIKSVMLPIMRAEYLVLASDSNDKESVLISEIVKKALFEWQEWTWNDFVRHALLSLPFGVSPFEVVWGFVDYDGKSYIVPVKIAPRLTPSIYKWNKDTETGKFGISQQKGDGTLVDIPADNLLIFVNEREGDNMWGTSILRAAYKHYEIKNTLYKIGAIAAEKQGLGIPHFKLPKNADEKLKASVRKSAQNMRANENAYLATEGDVEVVMLDMKANGTLDVTPQIVHHNREILKSVLAQFLELGGESKSGSRSVSEDHSSLFLKAIETIATNFVDTINKNLIPQIVAYNFPGSDKIPRLDYAGIEAIDVKALSESYSTLITAGAIQKDKNDEVYLRGLLGLPQRDMENDEPVEPKDPSQKNNNSMSRQGGQISQFGQCSHNRQCVHKFEAGLEKKNPRTKAEEKVDFEKIGKTLSAAEKALNEVAEKEFDVAKRKYLKQMIKAIQEGDSKAAVKTYFSLPNNYRDSIEKTLTDTLNFGRSEASGEVGITTPRISNGEKVRVSLLIDNHIDAAQTKINVAGRNIIASNFDGSITEAKTHAMLEEVVDDVLNRTMTGTLSAMNQETFCVGRATAFNAAGTKLQSLQRSELMDDKTCDFCASIDGVVIKPNDSWGKTTIFHEGCRGLWVGILEDEEGAPSIDGVPSEISELYDGVKNTVTQPSKIIEHSNSIKSEE